jgi:hypothetical protein
LSSISDAKSKSTLKPKIAKKCTAFLRLHTPNSPTRFREDPQFEPSASLRIYTRDPDMPGHEYQQEANKE